MLNEVLDALIATEPFERLLTERARPVLARTGAGEDAVAAALARALDAPVLLVAPGPHEAERLSTDLRAWLGADRSALLPAWEALPYEGISPSPEVAARRSEAVRHLRRATGAFVLVTPALAAISGTVPTLGLVPPVELAAGAELAPDALSERLVALGYSRSDVVAHRGEFAVRGGVLDVFPGTARRPVRLEYWGDRVESLREFLPSSQLSTKTVARVEVPPVRELVIDDAVAERARALAPRHLDRFRDGLERIGEGLHAEGAESLAPLLFDHLPVPAELLPAGSWVVVVDARRTFDRARSAAADAAALAEAAAWPGPPAVRTLDDALDGRVQLHLSAFTEGVDLGLEGWGSAQGNPAELAKRAAELAARDHRIVLTGRGHGSVERLREFVAVSGAETVEAPLSSGFVLESGRITVATEEDVFGSRRHTRDAPRFTSRRTDAIADELEPGDFAVHRVHGVGRYDGIHRRAIGGSERDYMVLEYAAGDRLSVPTDQVGMVARYLGGEAPRLSRLGTSDWVRTTRRVKRAVRDMAGELVRLYSVRMSVERPPYGPDTPWQTELEDAFPHEETDDQLTAIDDVKADLSRPKPMDRLICGDVGFGKTEIAVRAAFKAVMEGKQVAVLVPTTLLAEQHFITFGERFAPFPVKIAMLSRFVPKAAQAETVADLARGAIDVVIGTHRLLSKDVAFKDLGLIVVDEEQRFGVAHKERLKTMRAHVDVLTMSATPIPRTLEMALTGIRDLSTIDTPPEDRQPVLTYVGPYDDGLALGAVRRELLREGQVFWVHNRVATIDRRAAWLQEQVPDARIVVAHGQLDEDALERRMMRFWDRDADVLVSTSIIESGLDVPNANTLVVDASHMLGLSQLYQLRGRVGRSHERAFAYLFFPPQRELTEEAHERLTTIARNQALGSGFQIALRDLEIRGAGNVLGAEQHGHIAAVGFDTYARLLQESVAELKGEPLQQEREVRIDLPVRAFVPPGWLEQEALRLDLYRRIGSAGDHERLEAVRSEAVDRYGQLPEEVQTLFAVGSLRITCLRLGVEEVSTYRQQVRITPLALPEALIVDVGERVPEARYLPATSTLNLEVGRTPGTELPGTVERGLLLAVGEQERPEPIVAAPPG
ncbi:MAG TPA: transcription-repair coupling factor [Actinomycetota bacterium]